MSQEFDRRTMLRCGLAAGATLLSAKAAFAAAPVPDPYLQYVNPELRPVAAQIMQYFSGQAPLSMATLPQQRMRMESYQSPPLADVPWERKVISGVPGQPDVTIYVINANAGAARPGILYTHGGGFVMGSAKSSLMAMQELCRKLDCAVVAVEYRLAPETTYAGSIEDNYAGLKWLHDHAAEIGVDPARIAILGESAGGGHAALLAITARDRNEVPVAFQCLMYPMLDDRTGTTRPAPPHAGHIIWTAQQNHFGWKAFLGMEPGGKNVPVRAVPARTKNLAGLPPAFIGVGAIDLFHDEDVEYARRLNDADVPTELIVVPGAFHAFDATPSPGPLSRWFTDAKLDALRRGLGIPQPG
jgi:acetyl esterase/lipase